MAKTHVMHEPTMFTRCVRRVIREGDATFNGATCDPITIVDVDPTCGRCHASLAVSARGEDEAQGPVVIDWLKLAQDVTKAIDDQLYASEVVDLLRRHGMVKSANPHVLAWARDHGFAPDSLWPDATSKASFNQHPPATLELARPHHRLVNHEPLDYDLDTLRWELACGHPLVVGIRTYAGIVDAPGGVIPLPQGAARGGHAMCVSGFSNERQALRIDNSWSEAFGERGRGWLPYEYVLNPLWCGEIHAVRVVRAG